jgi:hypothetical protein
MSFWKAEQLLTLAMLVAARHLGLTLDDVIERFEVSKRTAQRMLRALEAQFSDTDVTVDDDGRKRWRLPSVQCTQALRPAAIGDAYELEIPNLGVTGSNPVGVASERPAKLGSYRLPAIHDATEKGWHGTLMVRKTLVGHASGTFRYRYRIRNVQVFNQDPLDSWSKSV